MKCAWLAAIVTIAGITVVVGSSDEGESESSSSSADPCPELCSCSPAGLAGSDPGLKVQCQPTEPITSVRTIELSSLPRAVIELDLADNKIQSLERDDLESLSSLEKLSLGNNQLEVIEDKAFANVTGLITLDLSGNRLSTLNSSMFVGLTKLETLLLASNRITQLKEGVFYNLFALSTLDLSGNDLVCDCQLKWIVGWARKQSVSFSAGSVCQYPDKLRGRPLKRLKRKELHCNWPIQTPSFEMNPTVSQVVFQGDSLLFRCHASHVDRSAQIVWLHNGQEVTSKTDLLGSVEMEVQQSPDGSTVSSSLMVSPLTVGHTGTWECSARMARGNKTRSVSIWVISEDTKHCSQNVTSDNKGHYIWPKTVVGVTVELGCEGLLYQPPYATYTCSSDGIWENLDTSQCPYISEVTKVLEQFSRTNLSISSRAGITESARRLRNYTSDGSVLRDKMDVVFIARTVENYLEYVSKQKEIGEILIDVVSTIMRVDRKLLRDAQNVDRACSKLVQAIERIPELVTEGPLNRYRDNIAVEEFIVKPNSFAGMTCTSYVGAPPSASRVNDFPYNEKVFECSTVGTGGVPSVVRDKVIEASIQLPESLFAQLGDLQGIPFGSTHKVQFTIFRNSKLFPHPTKAGKGRAEITTSIISSRLAKLTVTNLTDPVVVMLRIHSRTDDIIPVWWDFMANGNFGDWSSDGCTIRGSYENLIVFQCNRLANFGLLQNVDQLMLAHARHQGAKFRFSHPAIYVGSTICILCLLTVIVTYLFFCRSIRMSKNAKHSLVNTWVSLALLCFFFTIGVYQTETQFVCQVLGVLLHYITLCALLWMLITISNLYKTLTKGRTPEPPSDEPKPPKPMLRFYLVGWGIAIIICGISGAINMKEYAGFYYCFLAFGPSLGAFYGPVGVLVFILCVFFCLIHYVVYSIEATAAAQNVSETLDLGLMTPAEQPSVDAHSTTSTNVDDIEHPPILQLRAHAVVLLLFLLTWASAAIATAHPFTDHFSHEEAIFSYIYGLLSSVLGGFVLLFFCVSRQDVRGCWRRLGHCRRWRDVYDTGLAAPPLTNSNGHVRQSTNSLESSFTNKSSHASRSFEAKGVAGKVPSVNMLLTSHAGSVPDGSAADIFYNPRQNGIARRFFEKSRKRQVKLFQPHCAKTDGDFSSDHGSIIREAVKHRLQPYRRSKHNNCISLMTSNTGGSGDRDSHGTNYSLQINPEPSDGMMVSVPSPMGIAVGNSPLTTSDSTVNVVMDKKKARSASALSSSAQALTIGENCDIVTTTNKSNPHLYTCEPMRLIEPKMASIRSRHKNHVKSSELRPVSVDSGKADLFADEESSKLAEAFTLKRTPASQTEINNSVDAESSLPSYAYVNHFYQPPDNTNGAPASSPNLDATVACVSEPSLERSASDKVLNAVPTNLDSNKSVTSLDVHSNIWVQRQDELKLKKETSV